MRKFLLMVGVTAFTSQFAVSQIFSENFESVSLSNGTGNIPAGWTLHNVDGKTPNTNVSYMGTDAWKVRSVSGTKAATSTSWYSPASASDDWLVTPAITIPAGGNYALRFKEFAVDPNFPDGYEVYINTVGTTVADFLATTPIHTTNAANSNGLTLKSFNISSFAGQTIYIAFRNNSSDKFLLHIDDVQVVNAYNNDAMLNTVDLPRYNLVNTNSTLAMNITNLGLSPITSITADWNDGTAHSATISGLNIAPGATANVNHTTAVNYPAVEEKTINVEISQVNGGVDGNPADNTYSGVLFNSTSSAPVKSVVIEEGTGTWCGWCPRGAVAMEYMYTNHGTQGFIGIAVHNGDPMAVAAYDNGANFSGYPSANADRIIKDFSVSQNNFVAVFNALKVMPTPVAISGTANISGNTLTVPMSAKFVTKFAAANIRLAAIVVEDDVTGTSSGYAQTNYYANNANGPMGGYEALPSTVPASQMVYDHVGRALLGGYNGEANSVPTVINDGDVANHTFTYTFPFGFDLDQISVVLLAIDQADGSIINAHHIKSSDVVSNEEHTNKLEFNVYPNPTSDMLNVSFEANDVKSLNVYDLNGKLILTKDLSGAANLVNVPVSHLASGSYLISISGDGATHTKVFVKK